MPSGHQHGDAGVGAASDDVGQARPGRRPPAGRRPRPAAGAPARRPGPGPRPRAARPWTAARPSGSRAGRPPIIRVHRGQDARPGRPVAHRPELDPGQQLAGGVGVLALHDVEVVGAQAGLGVGVLGGQGGRRRDGGVVDARTAASPRPRTLPGRWERSEMPASRTPSPRPVEHDGGRTLVRRAQHEQVQRRADQPRGQHLLGGDGLAEHGVGVGHPVPAVLDHHLGQVVARSGRSRPAGAGPAGRSRPAPAVRPAASCHGAKNDERMMPFGIFSMPKTSTRSCWPEAMDAARQLQGRAARGAAGLDVVDGRCPCRPATPRTRCPAATPP